jgi:hypothetical protein
MKRCIMNDQNEVTTLQVRKEAGHLKNALVQMSYLYLFDGVTYIALCNLNTKNFNYFLNGFNPSIGTDAKGTNTKATYWIRNHLALQKAEGDSVPNEGPKWWQDPGAHLDTNYRAPPMAHELASDMEVEGTRKRDRSQHTLEEEWQTYKGAVEELREDIERSKAYSLDDLQKIRKQCVHYHKQRTNNIDGRKGPATLGDWAHLKEDL